MERLAPPTTMRGVETGEMLLSCLSRESPVRKQTEQSQRKVTGATPAFPRLCNQSVSEHFDLSIQATSV